MKERDYKKEYREYHSKPEQKKNRAARNKARREMGLKIGDPREVDTRSRCRRVAAIANKICVLYRGQPTEKRAISKDKLERSEKEYG